MLDLSDLQIYLVGGAVRDECLGLPIIDKDWVVVGATPHDLLSRGFLPVGKDFPVFLHPETKEEYALARQERKISQGYHGFEFQCDPSVTLVEDLARRDLTINAIAKDVNGQYIDPFGGIADLKAKQLKHVSAAFVEDPVRILRVARFAARYASLGFVVHETTKDLLKAMVVSGEVKALVAERVWQEWQKALSEKTPMVFFSVLKACGALAALAPEVDELICGEQQQSLALAFSRVSLGNDQNMLRFVVCCLGLSKTATMALMARLKCPKRYQRLVKISQQVLLRYPYLEQADASQWVDLFYRCDAFRQPTFFFQGLQACYAFTGKQANVCQLAPLLLTQCQAVSSQDFLKQGLQGEAIAKAQKAARIEALETWFIQQPNIGGDD